ncbi:luciferase [Mycobacterium kansasii]|uniref:Alkanal monooxygenase alpha chain n=1 Tax=Mycobacterium attenuatum TaxID=2341086 RepID=A0A498PN71_9MYCO|nr:LLM class flavin-dependent oxidoreductase [Mycobacterium attenuatum]ORB84901.1 luciferase [Mycobacterium kansasii]VBA31646.1 Alkanal monooxygenase alpha chain [Mycobacterium attenuatum]VBA44756.1 Alkanal monooxygenase alpha chain [Mycobacterium attenuatum]VBA45485.1 Alkanal monooxygenase alpha chain [Mycobacterium attenuatum]
MPLLTALRLNMTNIADPAARHTGRYQAALEMAEFADAHGFTAVSGEEHHLAHTGWLPSPLILAAAVAGRTRSVRISINALIVPLYDPIRLAEDIAVLDNLAQGRFSLVAGMGYRPEEYHAAGKDWSQRGALLDRCLSVMLKAWSDEPFEHEGALINVTPKPHTQPHPIVFVGGMTVAAARRAARFGLPFSPPMAMPELAAVYQQELRNQGKQGFVYHPENGSTVTLLHPDPDEAWSRYGSFIMNETAEYSAWKRAGVPRPNEKPAGSVDELRALNNVEILTPEQLIDQIRSGRREVVMNPLVGGLPLDAGWASLQLLTDKVLPRV